MEINLLTPLPVFGYYLGIEIMLNAVLIGLAVIALLSVIFEEVTHINKAKTTLFLGCLSWMILFFTAGSTEHQLAVGEQLNENLLEIATLWLFLMSTMTFVAYLNSKGLIQVVVQQLLPVSMSQRTLMLLVAFFALLLSAICDNVTATLVSLGLVNSFRVEPATRLKMGAMVVFAVNSGGVSMITGDVTTLMIFMAGHVTMGELLMLLVPSMLGVVVLAGMFSVGMQGRVTTEPVVRTFSGVDVAIAIIFFATIVLTMVFNVFFNIPPVLTFLSGMSLMFLVGLAASSDNEQTQILEYIRQIEFETLLFFLGILLLVGMLQEIHVLHQIAQMYADFDPKYSNFVMGTISALIDNVPLTAALIKAHPELSTPNWLGLTYGVGVGGSLLVIGSASGIVMMGKVEGMTFGKYLRFFPALLLAYGIGYVTVLVLANTFYPV